MWFFNLGRHDRTTLFDYVFFSPIFFVFLFWGFLKLIEEKTLDFSSLLEEKNPRFLQIQFNNTLFTGDNTSLHNAKKEDATEMSPSVVPICSLSHILSGWNHSCEFRLVSAEIDE